MNVTTIVADGFFRDGEAVRQYAVTQKYLPTTGPDGATYPGICPRVPEPVLSEATWNLHRLLGGIPVPRLAFFRLTLDGDLPPHWAHTDSAIAERGLIVYLTEPGRCAGGTAVLEHASGMDRNPTDEAGVALWRRDTNDESAWHPVDVVGMKFNRGVVCPMDRFHAPLPRGGFGTSVRDGRLVLVTFFDLEG